MDKKLLRFGPAFFAGVIFQTNSILAGLITFLAYSFAASSIYCFNDIYDVEDDRRHPVKCKRPIAAGDITIPQAYGLMGLMFLLAMSASSLLLLLPNERVNPIASAYQTGSIILFYWLLNLAYCAKLKQYAIIDVCIVAFGFVLRLLAGGFAVGVVLSKWIVLMTFLITLFMSFAKRRDDVLRMEKTGEAPRKNTIRYNLTFINQAITITASVTLVCYIMYTVSPEVIQNFHSDYLYLTSIFVLVGLLRYIQVSVVDKKSGDPTKVILRDRFTQCVLLAWVLAFLLIIYVF
jgi:4-hydroxybenzoate polyprenyltransferase